MPDNRSSIEHIERRVAQALLFLIPSIFIIFLLVFRETNFKAFFETLNYKYLLYLIILMFVVWLLDVLRFSLIISFSHSKLSFKRSFEIILASFFGANVTPFYSGGIATQIYFLSKLSQTVGKSTAISVIYMILTLIVYLIFSLILLFTPHSFITGLREDFFMGLAIFVFVLSFLAFFFMLYPKKAEKIVDKLSMRFSLGDKKREKIRVSIEEFSEGLKFFFTQNKFFIALTILITFVSQTLFFLFTPVSFMALSIPFSFKEVMLTQIAMQFTTSIGATPGGIGIVESAFAAFFHPLAGGKTAQLTLLWRSISFYIPTIVGSFFFYKLLHEKKL